MICFDVHAPDMCSCMQTWYTTSVKYATSAYVCMWMPDTDIDVWTFLPTVCHYVDHIRTVFSFQWVPESILDSVCSCKQRVSQITLHIRCFLFLDLNYWMYIYILPLLVYLPTVCVVHAWTWHWTTHTARTMASSDAADAIAEKFAKEALVAIIWHILFFTCDNVSLFLITHLHVYCLRLVSCD